MDLRISIIHVKDFLRVSPTGELDLEATQQVFLKLASVNEPPADHDILVDLRSTVSHLTLADIPELVELMGEHRSSFRNKIAILLPGDPVPIDRVEFMELYAHNRGFQVASFTDFEDAMNWLMISTDPEAESTG